MTSQPFSVDDLPQLRARLQALVRTYLFECDPANWPTLENVSTQQARYWAKRHAADTLKQIATLQKMLQRMPAPESQSEGSETAELVADAKRRGAALRERLGTMA